MLLHFSPHTLSTTHTIHPPPFPHPPHPLPPAPPPRYLTGAIEVVSETSGLSQEFLGLIVLPIAGNACEHITAVFVAMKNKCDLALGVALGSSIQVWCWVGVGVGGWYWVCKMLCVLLCVLLLCVLLLCVLYITAHAVLQHMQSYIQQHVPPPKALPVQPPPMHLTMTHTPSHTHPSTPLPHPNTQIAIFVLPVVVLVGWLPIVNRPMTLSFSPFGVFVLTVSVIHAYFVSSDGRSNWLMGLQLVITYLLIALVYYFVP